MMLMPLNVTYDISIVEKKNRTFSRYYFCPDNVILEVPLTLPWLTQLVRNYHFTYFSLEYEGFSTHTNQHNITNI